ncbi:cysteine desulfurase family protein [Sporolactobacillus terrae]|uniref:Aminotransferase V n=1 Tax=Sporolactobacillus terrae TaxID=269673 RepID=A0A410DA91_9BACL|nr:cysteine desulfurase family protein [Sporolactobacillus terrae]QAA23037.1 cysteine desulfurase [Sporolactobacillus terrae]QAA26010.1 cysteine desulfurase [Sporolactobacillus terrae]UAK15103.1 cysteine desulfurase [Sporolactobacillus terrae]BBN99447.1 aminotransferase V [Sporolactobacillus terrae]
MIYLDNSATTKPYAEVLDTYRTVSEQFFANPSSLHSLGGKSEQLLTRSREQAAALLGVEPGEIVFTSGGTEGNNLAIKGAAFAYRKRGKHLITTAIEHASAGGAFTQLESLGFDVTYLPVDRDGRVSFEQFKQAYRDDTILVSLMHVNNEVGTVQPVKEIAAFLSDKPKTVFHVDHVQGFSKVPLQLAESGIDLCTISGHKFHGPKGTGLLYVRQGTVLSPLFAGGGQEQQRRSGTENLPGICGMVKALRITREHQNEGICHLQKLQNQLFEGLRNIDGAVIHTPVEHSAPSIVNVALRGVKSEVLVHALEKDEIYVSTKSACSSKENKASAVLTAMGISDEEAEQTIRISLAYETTEQDIAVFLKKLAERVGQLKIVMR